MATLDVASPDAQLEEVIVDVMIAVLATATVMIEAATEGTCSAML